MIERERKNIEAGIRPDMVKNRVADFLGGPIIRDREPGTYRNGLIDITIFATSDGRSANCGVAQVNGIKVAEYALDVYPLEPTRPDSLEDQYILYGLISPTDAELDGSRITTITLTEELGVPPKLTNGGKRLGERIPVSTLKKIFSL